MRLGFAVKVLGEGGLASHDARRWQSQPHLSVSLGLLDAILDYLGRNEIHMYRMATALAPYASHPDLPQFHRQVDDCVDQLAAIGAKAAGLGIRLSTHPGQYTVLNSENEDVARAAIAEVEAQGELFEAMGLPPEAVIVLHVGGKGGGVDAALDRFEKNFASLSERGQSWLVVENDDRSFDTVSVTALARRIGRPVVWDIHHHRCLDEHGISDGEALDLALGTWPTTVIPKVHFSSPRLDLVSVRKKVGRNVQHRLVAPPLRAHADLIDPASFEAFLDLCSSRRDLDVMLEAKGKDLALLRLRDQLAARGGALPA